MGDDTAQSQLTAYLLSILVHHDRGIRAAGPPRNRKEWGIGRIGDYLRAIGRETLMEGDEAALWALLRGRRIFRRSRRACGGEPMSGSASAFDGEMRSDEALSAKRAPSRAGKAKRKRIVEGVDDGRERRSFVEVGAPADR